MPSTPTTSSPTEVEEGNGPVPKRLARTLYTYVFLEDFILLYPVYALLFTEHGLTAAEISSLFVIWSVTSFLLEVPAGVWADMVSKRFLLSTASALVGCGFALWTVLPSYPSFAVGFLLWGAGGALRSGTLQALAYEELEKAGAARSYTRLMGRARGLGTAAVALATALASPVLALGGYGAVGMASIVVCALGIVAGQALPETAGASASSPDPEDEAHPIALLKQGFAEVRASRKVLGALVLASVTTGVEAMDEYLPLLVVDMGAADTMVPLLLLTVMGGMAAGQYCAEHGSDHWLGPVLLIGSALLAVGALSGHPVGIVPVAVAFGAFEWARVRTDALLQSRIGNRTRATVSSLAGLGMEVVAVLVFAGYALGSVWWGPSRLLAMAAVPYVFIAIVLICRAPGSATGKPVR
ncbi:MFS transporter [Streptomyces sp. NPDC094448]|uniref:MFS transporter n=1 Tax=Streptomyces sp. NPDC094448 TaxID=3366063 RepID=UPI0037FB0662